jgi:two-component system LytT family sensor kinase
MRRVNIGELLNLVGLSAGIVLYAMLLAMVVRAGRTPGLNATLDPLLLLTSLLGLVWNLCALAVYELPKVGVAGPFPYLAALGFSALGFLPAVVVHSVLRGERQTVRGKVNRSLAMMAYGVSAVAAGFHIHAVQAMEPVPASVGMRLLTYSFLALAVPLAVVTRGQPGSRRALWAAALAIFAVSALHLSQLHQGDVSWPIELVGHHASLPLAIAILYQDYPFALADLFLKRALALLAIISVAFTALATLGARSTGFPAIVLLDPRHVGLLLTLWVVTALLYPSLRRVTAWFVDTVVLHRPDYRVLRAAVARSAYASDDVPTLLSEVCDLLTPALSAPFVTWREVKALDLNGTPTAGAIRRTGAVTLVNVPTVESPEFVFEMGELSGGRRLLSDDVATLEVIAVTVARRIDAIRITQERYEREIREQEIGKLATEAELRALRAQINPHFLFNALTTVGYLIQTAPPRALETLLTLTGLLRAVLRSEGEFTTLGRELEVVESYLEIECVRFEQRLRVTIDVPSGLRHIRLPPLILQPLVENAVKHGIANKQVGGEVTVRARADCADGHPHELWLTVADTGAGTTTAALQRGRRSGVGLQNIERRLECQYGPAASLSIRTAPDEGTVVEIRMPIEMPIPEEPEGHQVAR